MLAEITLTWFGVLIVLAVIVLALLIVYLIRRV